MAAGSNPLIPREVNFNYTEANSWQYSFFVPQDIDGLIEMIGGKEKFIERLDQLFNERSETTGREQSDITGLIGQYAHGNEPSHHMAYLYNYVDEPWKTQQRTRQIMGELYHEKPDGLCGNEDCGQMSAWYVLSAMGFYPVTPGSSDYAIGSPLFDKVTIYLENGKTFCIEAHNNSGENIYIQSARISGKDYTKTFFSHGDIINGGELNFEMGPTPNKNWGTNTGDSPVSAITENLIMPVPFIEQGARTFIDTTKISIGSIIPGSEIYYTIDDSEPSENAIKYGSPFVINETTTLKAMAISEGYPASKVIKSTFYKIPVGRKIVLNTTYANQYAAGGNLALIDFIRGPLNFRTGAWQGYEGENIDAIIDLGSHSTYFRNGNWFPAGYRAWIFLPEKVDFAVSTDGKNYQTIASVKNDVDKKDTEVQIKNFTAKFSTKARYIKVVAKNTGTCPEWHWGAGNKAWIFADEIVIK